MDGRSYARAVSGMAETGPADLLFPISLQSALSAPPADSFVRAAGRKNGKPAIFLSDADSELLALPFKFTLIGKFTSKQPKMDVIKRHFELLKLSGDWNIGYLDNRHIMVKLSKKEDYTLIFTKRMFYIDGVHVKFLKWTLDFNYKNEPPIAPVWIRLPGLKLHYFHQDVLFSIASIFGKPLKIDIQTHNFTRPSAARILVEMDISLKHCTEVWLGSQTNGYWQQVIFDNIPYYCSRCSIFGHAVDRCYHDHPELRIPIDNRNEVVLEIRRNEDNVELENFNTALTEPKIAADFGLQKQNAIDREAIPDIPRPVSKILLQKSLISGSVFAEPAPIDHHNDVGNVSDYRNSPRFDVLPHVQNCQQHLVPATVAFATIAASIDGSVMDKSAAVDAEFEVEEGQVNTSMGLSSHTEVHKSVMVDGQKFDLLLWEESLRRDNPFASGCSPNWGKALEEASISAELGDETALSNANRFAPLENYVEAANDWEANWDVHNSRRTKKRGVRELRSLQWDMTQPAGAHRSHSRRPSRTNYNSS